MERQTNEAAKTALQKEKAWRAQFLRVMFEFYGFSAGSCAKIWNYADKLLHHEQLKLIRTFSDDKAEMLIDIVAACTKDKAALSALKVIAALDQQYGWTLKRMPPLTQLTTTSLTSLAELIK